MSSSFPRDARYVSFASAGTRGVMYIGVLEALEDNFRMWNTRDASYVEWREALAGAAGTSAGAVAALVLLLGLDRPSLRETMRELEGVVVRHESDIAPSTFDRALKDVLHLISDNLYPAWLKENSPAAEPPGAKAARGASNTVKSTGGCCSLL